MLNCKGCAFCEDPLRMLRAVQFAARMGMRFDAGLSASMRQHAHLISTISGERISGELCKLLTAPKPSLGFALLRSHGLLKLILPELAALSGLPQPKAYHRYDVFSHSLVAMDRVPVGSRKGNKQKLVFLRWLALCHDLGKATTLTFKEDGTPQYLGHDDTGADIFLEMAKRLKLTAVADYPIDIYAIAHAIRHHMFECDCSSSPKAQRRFMARVGRAALFTQLRLRIADRLAKGMDEDVSEWVAFARQLRVLNHGQKAAFSVKDLAVNGNDVMAHLGLKPGKRVGAILNGLFQAVLDDPTVNTKASLLALAADIQV